MTHHLKSRSVDWWTVRLYVLPRLENVGTWPLAGSPPWQDLPANHPAKLAAVLDGGQHWALRVETSQAACAQASRDISAAADWPAIARSVYRQNAVYIPRRRSA